MPPSVAGARWVPARLVNAAFVMYRALCIHLAWLVWIILPRRQHPLVSPDTEGVLYSVNTGAGIPKRPVPRAFVSQLGIAGDRQLVGFVKPWGGHGGPDKAVMLWSLDVIRQVADEGHPNCQPGRCGEQLTVAGVDWRLFKTGARVQIGESVLLEVTFLKLPCGQQEPNFTEAGDGMQRISPQRHPDSSRVLARVLCGGYVAAGDRVAVYRSPRAVSGRLVRSKVFQTAFVSEEYN